MPRAIVIFAGAVALFAAVPMVRADSEVELGRQAEKRGDSEAALGHYLTALQSAPNDPVLLDDVSRQYSDLSDSQPTLEERRKDAQAAVDYSQRADEAAPNSAVYLTSLAVSYGKLSMCSPVSEKVKLSREIEQAAANAAQLDPDYAWAHHVLGRWNYEVARLSGASRFLLRVFQGGVPAASYAAAERELTRATELDPREPAHWIELGFVFSAEGKTALARKCWQRGLDLPGEESYQKEYKNRATKALEGG